MSLFPSFCYRILYKFNLNRYNDVTHHNYHRFNFRYAAVKDDTHVTILNNQRKIAFTLAEILITLGIIGVVFAMTMPTLIHNHQKKQTAVKLAKVYSTLTQAIERAKADYGDMAQWEYFSSGEKLNGSEQKEKTKAFVQTYILPYLKISKDCGINNEKQCKTVKICNNSSKTYCLNFVSNGAYYFITPDASYTIMPDNNTGVTKSTMIVKINLDGNSKPNFYGRDVFWGFIVPEKHRFEFIGADLGYTRDEMLNNTSTWGCNKVSNTKHYCAAIIQIDGWEIRDDYPW